MLRLEVLNQDDITFTLNLDLRISKFLARNTKVKAAMFAHVEQLNLWFVYKRDC